MKGVFDLQTVLGGLAIVLGVLLWMAVSALIFSPEAKKRKRKKYCMVLGAATACACLAALIASAPRAGAQASGFYRRVTFPNSFIPTQYQPYTIYTNNGTNSGYSAPVTASVTNGSYWTSSYYAPSNYPNNAVYIGRDWLAGLPVTLEVGIATLGTNNGATWSNSIAFSPDGNYWTASNALTISGVLSGGPATNWFYIAVPPTLLTNNYAFAAWDGIGCQATGATTIVYFGYQVPHPTF